MTNQTTANNGESLVSIAETGKRLSVGRKKVTALLKEGRLTGIRLGQRCVRVRVSSIQQLING